MVKVLLQKGGPGKTFKPAILEWLRDVKGWEVTTIEDQKILKTLLTLKLNFTFGRINGIITTLKRGLYTLLRNIMKTKMGTREIKIFTLTLT